MMARWPPARPVPAMTDPSIPPRSAPQALSVRARRLHGTLAPLALAPLLVTVISGMAYRLVRDWGGVTRDQAHWLMALHEGEWLRAWLGPAGETCAVALNGLGLLVMLLSGAGMLWPRLQRQWRRLAGEEGT